MKTLFDLADELGTPFNAITEEANGTEIWTELKPYDQSIKGGTSTEKSFAGKLWRKNPRDREGKNCGPQAIMRIYALEPIWKHYYVELVNDKEDSMSLIPMDREEFEPDTCKRYDDIVMMETRLKKMQSALQPLVEIADAYDRNALDDEARKIWGENDEHECTTQPDEIELYSGRGGKRLLTLADCFRAREVMGGKGDTIDLRGRPLTRQDLRDAYEAVINASIGGLASKPSTEDLLWEAMRAWGKILEGEEVEDHTAVVNWLVDWLPKVKEVLG